MLSPQELASALDRNTRIVIMQANGLSHADSLQQLPFRANCLNWVLGHMANNRDAMLQALGQPALLSEAEAQRYANSSDPVMADEAHVLTLEELLAKLERSQQQLAQHLATATEDDLALPIKHGERTITLAQRLFFLYFHETYHVGQTELLRQATGKNDHII